jgi:Biotin-protein ligase, N terminal
MKPLHSHLNPLPSSAKIGIYMGAGASHSWLWFVDILDRMGFYDIHFINERDILKEGLERLDVLLMSGGDTFAIAEGLGAEGSDKLRSFIEGGGLYIGTCAGAYLPLRSSMDFLNRFNFINVKISNISRRLSEPERQLLQKVACSSYGCDFVFHVVREDVLLKMVNGYQADGKKEMIAPLFGGPSMLPSEDIEPIAMYKGFTKKTKFLVEEKLAEKTLIGNIAVAKKSMGKGHLYIFGPHFEHPQYPEANRIIIQIILEESKERGTPPLKKEIPFLPKVRPPFFEELRRELSHSRMVAFAMEGSPLQWVIGNKWYEPEKIRVFLEVLWKRLRYLESGGEVGVDLQDPNGMISRLKEITDILRKMKKGIDRGETTNRLADDLFPNLKKVTSDFLTVYFSRKKMESTRSKAE